MKRKKLFNKIISSVMVAAMAMSLVACGAAEESKESGNIESGASEGTVKEDGEKTAAATEGAGRTEFTIMGGMSALSGGYEDNEVLNVLQEKTGISIEWNTFYAENTGKEALPEQVTVELQVEICRMHLWVLDLRIMIFRDMQMMVLLLI